MRAAQSPTLKTIGNPVLPAKTRNEEVRRVTIEVEKGIMLRSIRDKPQLLKADTDRNVPSHLDFDISKSFI